MPDTVPTAAKPSRVPVTPAQAATVAGVAGVGSGVLLGTLSLQGVLDRITTDMGVGGLVALMLLVGAVVLIVWLIKLLIGTMLSSVSTAENAAVASTQSASATASVATQLRELRDIVGQAVDGAERVEVKVAALELGGAAHAAAIAEIKASLKDVLHRLESDPAGRPRQGVPDGYH